MGKFSKNVIRGVNRHMKISLILLLTAACTAFIGGGWSSPRQLHATVAIASCADCHGYPPVDGARSGGTFLGSHSKHAGSGAGQSAYACSYCHIQPVASNWKHADGFINITGSAVKGSSYLGTKRKQVSNNPVFYSCNNIYCHSTVQAVNGTSAGIADTTPLWGATGPITCTTNCHKNEPTTNNHAQHLSANTGYAYSCATCHTAQTATTHANGTITMLLSGTNAAYKIAGTAYTAVPPATSLAFGSCSTTACHGQTSPVWGTVGNTSKCLKCHGVRAGTFVNVSSANVAPGGTGTDTGGVTGTTVRGGTHQEHLNAATGISDKIHCGECHAVVNNTVAAIATHLNMTTATTSFGPLAKTQSHSPSTARVSGATTCTNTYCHTGKMNSGTAMVPSWNNTNYLATTLAYADCTKCHGLPPRKTFGHASTAVATTYAQIGTLCSGCHGATLLASGATSWQNVFKDKTKHLNGSPDATGHTFPYPGGAPQHKADAGGTPWSACSGCHSTAATGVTYASWVTTGHPTKVAPNCSVCHLNGLTSNTCSDCHGVAGGNGQPNGGVAQFPNYSGSHRVHMTKILPAPACSSCHSGYGAGSVKHGFANTTTTTRTKVTGAGGRLNFVGLATIPTWVPATMSCNNTCHGSGAVWGGRLKCVDCHDSTTLVRTKVTPNYTMDNVVAEFKVTGGWGHTRSQGFTVTDEDCIVCHLEGSMSTLARTALHGDGNIDLRDHNTATNDVRITDLNNASKTFQRFSTSYAAGSRSSTAANTVDNIVTRKFCLGCHKTGGSSNTTAGQGGIAAGGTALKPFGATGGTVLDINSQFATTNSSKHPVLGPLTKDFPTPARLSVPYNGFTRAGVSGTKTTGVVINCFDCHNVVGTPLIRRTVSAHGNAVTIRGVATVSGTPALNTNQVTFCIICHTGYNPGGTTSGHGVGSSLSGSTNNGMVAYIQYGCNMCHSSGYSTPVLRPVRAQDVHGVNALPTGGLTKSVRWAGTSTGTPARVDPKPYAFIRNTQVLSDHSPKSIAGSTYSPNCNMASGSPINCNQGQKNYTVGGTY